MMNIGDKIDKPVSRRDYAAAAGWCNRNNAHMLDKGEYFEITANPPPEVAAAKDDPTAVWWSWFGIIGTLIGIGMAYRGRIIMTSVPHLTVVYPRRYFSSGGSYDSDSSYSSGDDSSSSSSRGGGSFGGGGASGGW